MSITKEITRLEKSNVRLNLTIPKEEVQSQYQDLLKEYVKNVQIPGFRKGKVPQAVLERKFGESLKGEALGKIVEKAVGEVFDDKDLPKNERPLPYSYPQMDEQPKLEFGQDLNFSITYDVMPEVTVGQWKGLEVEVSEAEITNEDIARELEKLRDRNAFVLDRDEAAQAQKGDIATIDYCEIGEDGEALPNASREGFAFTLGTGSNAYEMDDDIIGMKKGETKEFTKAYPADEAGSAPTINAGKTIKLKVTLTALKEKKLPDLDDDLAQDIDEKFRTLDDLKSNIRTRLENQLSLRIKDLKISAVLEKIMENTPVILPESMVRAELEGRMRTLARNLGTDVETIMRMMQGDGEGPSAIEQRFRPQAERAIHSRLIVDTLLEEQHIEVSDEEIEKELEKIAADSNDTLENVRKHYEAENAAEYLKDSVKEQKFFDMLLAESTIKAGPKKNYLDLIENNG